MEPVIGGPEEGLVSWVDHDGSQEALERAKAFVAETSARRARARLIGSVRAFAIGALIFGTLALIAWGVGLYIHDSSPVWFSSGATLSGGK
jgi:hypothetical protein